MEEVMSTFNEVAFKLQGKVETFTVVLAKRGPVKVATAIFVPLIVLLFVGGWVYPEMRNSLISSALGAMVAFGLVIFYLINSVTEEEIIELYDDKVIVKHGEPYTVNITDIVNYKINYYQGVSVIIELKNGGKKVIAASSGRGLEAFCIAFDKKMQTLIVSGHLPIERKKSFAESKWFLYVLCAVTIFYVVCFIGGAVKWHELPPTRLWFYFIYPIAGWAAYFKTKQANKNKL